MKIRRHTKQDYPAIAKLRWLLKSDDSMGETGPAERAFVSRYLKHLRQADASGDTTHWLVELDGKVVGVMTVRKVKKEPSPTAEAGRWGYLTNSVVLPGLRNRGYGTRLLEHIKTWAIAEGYELLVVWPSERSYDFYRRAGFKGQDDPLQLELLPDS